MTLNINDITDELNNAQLEDQTKDDFKGGFTIEKIPMGKHPVRLVQYIEYGNQPQPDYQGAKKPDAPEVVLTFEFLGKRTVKQREDGKGEIAPRKSVYLKKSFNEKSGYRKLFEKMRGGDTTITHMAQMVASKAWLMNIEWSTSDKDDSSKRIKLTNKTVAEYEARLAATPDNKDFRIWDNMKGADGFMISAAVRDVMDEDGEPTGEQAPVSVREPIGALNMFLWDNPKPMFWDSIYIDGSYTKKVDGKEETISKNRHQAKAMAASNFAGSALEAMLGGVDDLPGVVDTKEEDTPPAEDDVKPDVTTLADVPADDDEMSELGL